MKKEIFLSSFKLASHKMDCGKQKGNDAIKGFLNRATSSLL